MVETENHGQLTAILIGILIAVLHGGTGYNYLENTLHMTIVNSKRVMTVEKITQIDEKYLDLNVNDYNCLAVITSQAYNSDGVMFEFTQSRHRSDYFRFQDNAVRRPVS